MLIPVASWLTGALLLVVAGVHHLARPGGLHDSLRRDGLLPMHSSPHFVLAWGATEASIGLFAVGAILTDSRYVVPAVLAAAIYGAFTAYLTGAKRRHRGSDCACIGSGTALDISVIVRAAALTVAAFMVVVIGGNPPPLAATVGIGSVGALLAWLVPQWMTTIPGYGAWQFGVEMGTGLRTDLPTGLPHLLAFTALFMGRPSSVFAAGLGFGLGRTAMLLTVTASHDPDTAYREFTGIGRYRPVFAIAMAPLIYGTVIL